MPGYQVSQFATWEYMYVWVLHTFGRISQNKVSHYRIDVCRYDIRLQIITLVDGAIDNDSRFEAISFIDKPPFLRARIMSGV